MRVEVFSKISAMFFPRSVSCGTPAFFFGLQGGGEVEQTGDLVGGEVQQGQKAVYRFRFMGYLLLFQPRSRTSALRRRFSISSMGIFSAGRRRIFCLAVVTSTPFAQ